MFHVSNVTSVLIGWCQVNISRCTSQHLFIDLQGSVVLKYKAAHCSWRHQQLGRMLLNLLQGIYREVTNIHTERTLHTMSRAQTTKLDTQTTKLDNTYISWIPWKLSFRYVVFHEKRTPNDAVTPQHQSQFTPKMKANAVLRLLSSLVWIDQYNECNGMTSFMEFMIYNMDIIEECIRDKIWFRCIVPNTILYGKNIGLHVLKLNNW